MLNTPGGPQQQLIQQLARSYGGQAGSTVGQAPRTSYPVSVDVAPGGTSYSVPGAITPYGNFHEAPNQDEVGPNAGHWPALAPPVDPAIQTAIGAQPQGLHPMIQRAFDALSSQPQIQQSDHRFLGLGAHPQVDRFHAIHASQNLAALMAQLTQRSLARNNRVH